MAATTANTTPPTETFIPRQGKLQVHTFSEPATRSEIAMYAPSVYAETVHPRLKSTYQQVKTGLLLDQLGAEGWGVSAVGQKFCKDPADYAHTTHFVRIRRLDAFVDNGLMEYVPEGILYNAHNGGAAWKLYLGVFRFVCGNGLVMGDLTDSLHLRHTVRRVGEGGVSAVAMSKALLLAAPEKLAVINQLRERTLTPAEQYAFAEQALLIRWDKQEGRTYQPHIAVTTDQVLEATLAADKGDSAWTVFNRVQYHLCTKGDLAGKSATGRQTHTRPITRATEVARVNLGLWNAMLRVAGIAKAANDAAKDKPTVVVPALAAPAPAKAPKAKGKPAKADPVAPKAPAKAPKAKAPAKGKKAKA